MLWSRDHDMGNTGKSGNGNGERNDDAEYDDNDTPSANAIGHRGNRRMLSILANYLTEAKTHSARLETLYNALKEMTAPPSPIWNGTLLSEFERHHAAEGENLVTLRAYMQGPGAANADEGSASADDEDDDDEDGPED